jgi:tRNA pseudouridine55 synthase
VTPHGVLIVDKPRGPTSHDVVAQARRLFRTKAVGHAGTLDPMASGVLVLLLGEATKLASYVTLDDKEYRATIAFGRSTDTLDAEGSTTEEIELPEGVPDDHAIEAALDAERARTEQVPPAFSAISVAGVRAHRLARSGEAVALPARPVTVRALTVVERTPRSVTVDLAASKGYYVRSLARDLGAHLGLPSHLAALQRRASGPYRIEDATPWPPADGCPLLSVEDAVARAMPVVHLTPEGEERARCGKVLLAEHFAAPPPAGPVSAWLSPGGGLVALGRPEPPGGFRVVRGFSRPPDPL